MIPNPQNTGFLLFAFLSKTANVELIILAT